MVFSGAIAAAAQQIFKFAQNFESNFFGGVTTAVIVGTQMPHCFFQLKISGLNPNFWEDISTLLRPDRMHPLFTIDFVLFD